MLILARQVGVDCHHRFIAIDTAAFSSGIDIYLKVDDRSKRRKSTKDHALLSSDVLDVSSDMVNQQYTSLLVQLHSGPVILHSLSLSLFLYDQMTRWYSNLSIR